MGCNCLLTVKIDPPEVFNTINTILQCMHVEKNSREELELHSILSATSFGVVVKLDDTFDYIVSPGSSIDEIRKALHNFKSSLTSDITLRSYPTLKELLHILSSAEQLTTCSWTTDFIPTEESYA